MGRSGLFPLNLPLLPPQTQTQNTIIWYNFSFCMFSIEKKILLQNAEIEKRL